MLLAKWLKIIAEKYFLWVMGSILLVILSSQLLVVTAKDQTCEPLGWFPSDFGLKDHSIFHFDGFYYLVSNYIPSENFFAYARSADLCDWEDLTPFLNNRTGGWDAVAVWAPFVFYEDGLYYMYYTGVRYPYPDLTQSIMLATSENPADPDSWEQQGMIFQPNHDGMIWQDDIWADCRDPMVIKVEDTYYLYYTGRDEGGGIIGLATATTPGGPWDDWGAILNLENGLFPESPAVFVHEGLYYLFYNEKGERFRIGASPNGPWSEPYPFHPGWAHEVWLGQDNQTYTSYLTDYSVTISPVVWDGLYSPSRPFIGAAVFHSFLPVQTRQD